MTSPATAAVDAWTAGTLPGRCGVVGGGTMGSGIAHALLLAGSWVVLLERDPDAAALARSRVERALQGSVRRGVIDTVQGPVSRLTVTTSGRDLATAGLVVEAVPEILDLKLETLRAIEDVVATDAVIGTNTSSMSIDLLAHAMARPERLIGLHFFNPMPASKLVEVVRPTTHRRTRQPVQRLPQLSWVSLSVAEPPASRRRWTKLPPDRGTWPRCRARIPSEMPTPVESTASCWWRRGDRGAGGYG